MLNLGGAVPAHHALRASKGQIDAGMRKLTSQLDERYDQGGRPSRTAEQRVKVCVWRALCSVRSERLCWEPLGFTRFRV